MWGRQQRNEPTLETVRKHARVLVIDDNAFPAQRSFKRDGYHFERWAAVENLTQLTDGHYHLILLDVDGVGMKESPNKQGLGILEHIKKTNPAQAVILYSSKDFKISASSSITRADAFLDKSASYVEYKELVDELLMAQCNPGYFISRMNQTLGENAYFAPKAVKLAADAFRTRSTSKLSRYLREVLSDPPTADTSLKVISVGIQVFQALHGLSS